MKSRPYVRSQPTPPEATPSHHKKPRPATKSHAHKRHAHRKEATPIQKPRPLNQHKPRPQRKQQSDRSHAPFKKPHPPTTEATPIQQKPRPSPISQHKGDRALAESHQVAPLGLRFQQLLCLPAGNRGKSDTHLPLPPSPALRVLCSFRGTPTLERTRGGRRWRDSTVGRWVGGFSDTWLTQIRPWHSIWSP